MIEEVIAYKDVNGTVHAIKGRAQACNIMVEFATRQDGLYIPSAHAAHVNTIYWLIKNGYIKNE